MKKLFGLLLVLCVSIISCSPSPRTIEKAIAETQTSFALLSTNTPTKTETSTLTPTPTETPTPTPTFTPTPDLRVIDGDPIDFLIESSDLPKESQYYIPNELWKSIHLNKEVINGWGEEEGRKYLERTGRVEGYFVYFQRGSIKIIAPEQIFCEVVKYKTAEGALISLKEFNAVTDAKRSKYIYTFANEKFPELGENAIAYYREWTIDSGNKYIHYSIETTFYNFLISCSGYGPKKEVDPQFVANLVTIELNKLRNAPLIPRTD